MRAFGMNMFEVCGVNGGKVLKVKRVKIRSKDLTIFGDHFKINSTSLRPLFNSTISISAFISLSSSFALNLFGCLNDLSFWFSIVWREEVTERENVGLVLFTSFFRYAINRGLTGEYGFAVNNICHSIGFALLFA